jgi:tRNA modification GTPase
MLNDPFTIAAISTASGVGGIGVVRMSGPKALSIAKKVCQIDIQPRKVHFSKFKDLNDQLIDEGLVLFFKSPHSFTGEDVVELQGHGGPIVLNLILNLCIQFGAKIASPGEFTKRAYLNSKLDLAQAESVVDLINASTDAAAKSAINSLSGNFSIKINDLLKKLIELRMYIEACLDFPEEDIDFITEGKVADKLKKLSETTVEILLTAHQGQLLRDGVNVVLIGQPNVGKSSLMNQLSGEDKAIVTNIPGTTRDPISSDINLEGIPVHITDTAGLRETDDVVEKFGIDKTWDSVAKSHIALVIVEANQGVGKYEKALLKQLPPDIKKFFIFNKIDLVQERSRIEKNGEEVTIYLSAKNGEGLTLLKNHIITIIGKTQVSENSEGLFIARKRHVDALSLVSDALKLGLANLGAPELVAEELIIAQKRLSSITGEFSSDDLLGEIFSQFCIGK